MLLTTLGYFHTGELVEQKLKETNPESSFRWILVQFILKQVHDTLLFIAYSSAHFIIGGTKVKVSRKKFSGFIPELRNLGVGGVGV